MPDLRVRAWVENYAATIDWKQSLQKDYVWGEIMTVKVVGSVAFRCDMASVSSVYCLFGNIVFAYTFPFKMPRGLSAKKKSLFRRESRSGKPVSGLRLCRLSALSPSKFRTSRRHYWLLCTIVPPSDGADYGIAVT